MKRIGILIIAWIVISFSLFSGCNEQTDEKKILGIWLGEISGDEETYIFNFFSNGTYSTTVGYTFWGTYVMTDDTLAIEAEEETKSFRYSFSNNDKKLTLIDVEQGGQFAVLTKYDSPIPIPSIKFIKNDGSYTYTLTVSTVTPSNVLWSNIEITGTCDTSSLGTYVIAGDIILDCSGTITIRYIPTNTLLGHWTYSPEIPSIQFVKDSIARTLTVAVASPSDIIWSDIDVIGNCDISGLYDDIEVGDMITDCYGTITIRHIPTNLLLGTWDFN